MIAELVEPIESEAAPVLAGDGAIRERVACGEFCVGCPICFDPVLDAEI